MHGWAANREDGTVEAVFEGEEDAVEEMVEWCRTGPRHARVTRVEVRAENPEGVAGFDVW